MLPFLFLSVLATPRQQHPTTPKSAVPADDPRWPSGAQLAAAEPDKGLHAATTKPPLQHTGNGMQYIFS